MRLAGFVIRLLCFDIPLHPLGDYDVAVLIAIAVAPRVVKLGQSGCGDDGVSAKLAPGLVAD